MKKQQIVALGGGGFSMETSPALDQYILGLADPNPKICFLATASGDSDAYITKFYRRFSQDNCQPTHLDLFHRNVLDLETFLMSQDIIYVGGGNTANMLAIWHIHGVDKALKNAYEKGTVLCGVSAGAICWFEQGVTDSFGSDLASYPCLGFIAGSNCPHYDGESNRRPAYHRLVKEGSIQSGVAADDGVALHYVNGELDHILSSRPNACAYQITFDGHNVEESSLPTVYLG